MSCLEFGIKYFMSSFCDLNFTACLLASRKAAVLKRSWEPWWTPCLTACPGSKASQQHPGQHPVSSSTDGRARQVIICLCYAHVRPHLQYCVQFWVARKDVRVQQRATKMVGGCLSCEEKLRELGLFSWRRGGFRGPSSSLPAPIGGYGREARLFTVLHTGTTVSVAGTREVQTGYEEKRFFMRTVKQQNGLPREGVLPTSFEVFKTQLSVLVQTLCWPWPEKEVGLETSSAPSNLNCPVIP